MKNEECCSNCKFIDLQKFKAKVDSAGKSETYYWCEQLKKYIQVDLFTCGKYIYERDMMDYLSSGKNDTSRTHKK